jgi:regulator of replication initiation timing
MEEQLYDQQPYGEENRSIKGYKIVIVILAVILAALSYMFYSQTQGLKADFAVQRDTLSNQISRLVVDMNGLKTTNDTITHNLGVERGRADSLLQRLQRERSFSASKIRQYEKELGTLRTVMRGFVVQIDSLNQLNKKVMSENVGLRSRLETERVERQKAEETAEELNIKVRQGAVIRARAINIIALSAGDREVTRASRAARLRVDFVLSANEIATLGQRNVYARIQGPDGYQMAIAGSPSFEADGQQLTYSAMREVDYQGQDLSVSLYYTGGGITEGTYKATIFMDGHQIGTNEIMLK